MKLAKQTNAVSDSVFKAVYDSPATSQLEKLPEVRLTQKQFFLELLSVEKGD